MEVTNSSRHPRVALVIHALYGGGAERLMTQLANRWASAGHEVHLITLADTSTDTYPVDGRVRRHGLNLMRPSRGPIAALKANWQRVRSLRALLAQLAPDGILSFCDRTNITTVTAALPLACPLWIAEHSDPSRQVLGILWETWRQWSYRRLARRPNSGCVVLTEAIADTFRARFHGLPIEVIPPAIHLYDCANILTQETAGQVSVSSAATADATADDRPFSVLSLGRHSPEKNLGALLRAWSQLAPKFPQWRLVLAGDGPMHAELKELAQHLHIGGSVYFAGWVSDPWSLCRQSNLLAITSHYEGLPVAMLEAMASGLPCVSTPCASTVKQWAQAGAVVLADSMKPEDIAQALSVAMSDSELRRQMSERGRSLAQEYSWDSIGLRWDELLHKVVTESNCLG